MERQLRMGGGIMDIVPREPAIFGGIKKAVKKVGKTVGKIAKSDLGKAALLAGGVYLAGGGGMPQFLGGKGLGGFSFNQIPGFLKAKNFVLGAPMGDFGTARGPNMLSRFGKALGIGKGSNLGKFATLGLVSKFLTDTLGMPPEEAEAELARDPSGYLEKYYRNLNPNATEEEVAEFVTTNTAEYRAEGGRIGFAEGPVLPPDPTQPVNPFGPKPGDFGVEEDIPIKMASNLENEKILEALFEKYIDMGLSPKDAAEAAQKEFERMSMMKTDTRGLAALGGRMNYSAGSSEISINKIEMLIKKGADNDLIKEYTGAEDGVIDQIRDAMERKNKAVGGKMDSASDNAMQAAGIEGLPVRQNPKGVKELDLRETGGFIPPVGIKEKEDDIPAMLSNNEFVFTADAVRGMGGGDVNKGAQRMYDMMKRLEAGGRV